VRGKVILVCGKIASGKTTYARKLATSLPAILLSTDEIMLPLFGQNPGANYHVLLAKVESYVLKKALKIIQLDMNVVLDWGFGTRERRQKVSAFFEERDIKYEWHYMDTSSETLRRNLNKRNGEIESGNTASYHFDFEIASKFWDMFEVPTKDEIDVWVTRKDAYMTPLNLIWILNAAGDKVLMCKRHKQPYLGLYNCPGGKIEAGESDLESAYRELQEETSITDADVTLVHVMSSTYPLSDIRLEIFYGKLSRDVQVHGDEKELAWIDITEDFCDMTRFAGDRNLGHIWECIKWHRENGELE